MRTQPRRIGTLIVVAAGVILAAAAWAGSLEPDAAPAPTMHTLEDLHQRALSMEQKMGADGRAAVVDGMVLIPAGAFVMGDGFDESGTNARPLHTVTLSAFYMDQYPVSKKEWDEVYSWALTNGYTFSNAGSGKDYSHPVQTVNWFDCVKWANARSEMEELTPCYYTDEDTSTVYRAGELHITNACVRWDIDGYRLPTEAEWEKAARGGAVGRRFPWADANTIDHSRANYSANPSNYMYDISLTTGRNPEFYYGGFPYTSPVGSFAPNGYGLFDVVGNVGVWCWDWYVGGYYASSPAMDPHGPDPIVAQRTLRGGTDTYGARVATRSYYTPDGTGPTIGLRLVRTAP